MFSLRTMMTIETIETIVIGVEEDMAEKITPAYRDALAFDSPADSQEIVGDVKRNLLHEQYSMAHRQLMNQMKVEDLEQLETEDDILDAAVALTR